MKLIIALAASAILGSLSYAEEFTVEQKDKTFSTETLSAKPGDTIVFKNCDTVAHNVFSSSAPNAFCFAVQNPGTSSTLTLKEEGVIEVRCAIHPKMKVLVTVKK